MREAPSASHLSRLSLTVKDQPTDDQRMTSTLLRPAAFLACAMSIQEHAEAEDGSLYFLTINMHAGQRAESATATAERIVNSLMEFSWRWAVGSAAPSCLGSGALGARPLAMMTLEQEAAGGFHSHGFLFVPTAKLRFLAGGHHFSESWVHFGLRVVRDCRRLGLEPLLHPESVHLIPVLPFEDIRSYSRYATKGWRREPGNGPTMDLFPGGKVARDWHPVSRRAGQLLNQLDAATRAAGGAAVAREAYLSALARGQSPEPLPKRGGMRFRWNVPSGLHEWDDLMTKPAHWYA